MCRRAREEQSSATPNVPWPPRHGQAMNVLWADMHVEAENADDLVANRYQYFVPSGL